MVKKILLVVLVLLAGFIVVAALQPAQFRYSRKITIAAPDSILFGQINDLRKFQDWNPWAKMDPKSRIEFSGPAVGLGSKYHWEGNGDVGEGQMTIIESRPNQLVRCRMDFKKPMEATNIAEFTFQPVGNNTVVTWSMSGANSFIGKAFGLVVNCDKMVGNEFEKGLSNLKEIAEGIGK